MKKETIFTIWRSRLLSPAGFSWVVVAKSRKSYEYSNPHRTIVDILFIVDCCAGNELLKTVDCCTGGGLLNDFGCCTGGGLLEIVELMDFDMSSTEDLLVVCCDCELKLKAVVLVIAFDRSSTEDLFIVCCGCELKLKAVVLVIDFDRSSTEGLFVVGKLNEKVFVLAVAFAWVGTAGVCPKFENENPFVDDTRLEKNRLFFFARYSLKPNDSFV